jgi:beta-alanine--pyruvate transaminase
MSRQAVAGSAQAQVNPYWWMPFTPNRDFLSDPKLVTRAEGVYYTGVDGGRILDGASGLFNVSAGHGRRPIADAVRDQLLELDFTPTFLRAQPRPFELARRIARLTPPGLDRVFFTNSGSEAVDSAMKIVLAYHRARGEGQRQMFVSRERAYHGVGFGSGSLSGMVNNRRAFGPGLGGVVHLRHTHLEANRFTRGQPAAGAELAEDLERVVALHGAETIAAVVLEPIAGSTGCLVPPQGYLQRIRELCDRHGLLLVFDEVITGLGRTGKPFAAQSFGVTPDLITMAKAITNGTQPMGAVAVRRDLCETVLAAQPNPHAPEFFHGYTCSAHPAAVAAALATLDLFAEEDLFAQAEALSGYFLDAVWSLADLAIVTDIRGYGMLAGFDVAADRVPGDRGYELQKRLFEAGLHIKTTGDSGLLAPAFTSTRAQIDALVDTVRKVLLTF